MSKWDKLLERVYSLSSDIRFEEIKKILESYGYKMTAPRSGSSHYTFRKKDRDIITIPKHKPIKKFYIELVKQVIETEEGMNEDS